jgi:hypothetical protein
LIPTNAAQHKYNHLSFVICFLDKAIEEIMNREDLLCIDDNGLVKYQYTETEIKKMVDDVYVYILARIS